MTPLPKRLLILGSVACVLGVAQPAAAAVQPAGTGEPAYTNSAQNTQWFEWPSTSGADGYRVKFDYYADNSLVADPIYDMPNGASNQWANWSGVKALQHGSQYGICAQGYWSLPNDSLFFPDGPNSCSMGTQLGRRASTTIDRSKPATSIALAGGKAYTNNAKIVIQTGFSDDVAGPFPANFMCFQSGGTSNICDSGAGFAYGYNSACSVPASGGRATTFTCTADFGSGSSPAPDGPVWACVIAADAAIPDNPSSPDQSGSAATANLSAAQCDGVLLDRTAPKVTIASPTAAKVGEPVAFGVQASDAGSGAGAGFEWAWGDNTGGGSGESVTHTFTRAGTYEVRVKTADAAGNPGTATQVVTVTAPATGGGGTTTTIGESVQPAGGSGGTPAREAGGVEVSAPRKLKLSKAKALPIALTAEAGGKVSFALVRSGRVIARGSKAIAAGTTSYRLKLPRRARAGRYVLKVTFTPAGGKASTSTVKVTLAGKARRAGRASASGARVPRVSAAGAPVALPDGRFHGVRKRSFVPRAVLAG